jgi:hypothetical protein
MVSMPLLVPLLLALAVVLAATMLWVWARSIAHVRHGLPVAVAVGVLAAAGLWLLLLSEMTDAVQAWVGWVLLAVSAVALAAGWIGLARWGVPGRR